MAGMSERLKETLGILESQGVEVKEIPSHQEYDEDLVGSKGGEIIPFEPKQVPTVVVAENSDIADDYITSRNITHTLIDMTGSALEGALSVAVETQHPKAYTIFNELATTMRGLSKDLLEMQKIYKEITLEKQARQAAANAQNVTQNNVKNVNITTTASVADILNMLDNDEVTVFDVEEKDIVDV